MNTKFLRNCFNCSAITSIQSPSRVMLDNYGSLFSSGEVEFITPWCKVCVSIYKLFLNFYSALGSIDPMSSKPQLKTSLEWINFSVHLPKEGALESDHNHDIKRCTKDRRRWNKKDDYLESPETEIIIDQCCHWLCLSDFNNLTFIFANISINIKYPLNGH